MRIMKIAEVLTRVRALYPHPFEKEELVSWCNDLGYLLTENYCERFGRIRLKAGEALPEGVFLEDVIKVIDDGGREKARDDILTDFTLRYPQSERRFINAGESKTSVTVIYRIPYEKIRCFEITDGFTLADGVLQLNAPYDLRTGDVLAAGDEEFYIDALGDVENTFKGHGSLTEGEKTLELLILDMTVTAPPWDGLYVEYLTANAARYLKDYEAENRALSAFNTMLAEYGAYLIRNGKTGRAIKFVNFM